MKNAVKKHRPLVYLASPYSQGNVNLNTRFQCEMFDKLMNDGIVWPIVPLWSHFQDVMFPRAYEDWMDYDFALLDRCDALIRLDARHTPTGYHQHASTGADREVAYVSDVLGLPVFFSIRELYSWADELRKNGHMAKELVDLVFPSVG